MKGYKGQIVSDWGRFEEAGGIDSPKAQQMLTGSLKAFMGEPVVTQDAAGKALLQANYADAANFPDSVLEVLKKFQQTTYFDNAYEKVFEMRDYRGSNRDGFTITDVQDTLAFRSVKTGEKARLYTMSGDKVTVNFSRYGGGLSWDRQLFDDKEYWTLENNAITFRNKWASSKAQNYYDVIDAVGAGQNIAWQAVTPAGVANTDKDYNAIRDINTINLACQTILLNCQDKGYGIGPNTPFIILAPIQLKGRLTNALPLVQQPFSSSTERLYYNITPSYSLMLAETDVYYVILPGIKTIAANRMDLTIYTAFDHMSYSDDSVGWGRYAGAIGDSEQFQRCAIV